MNDIECEKKLTTAQMAKICGVSIPTIHNWISKGMLKCEKTLGGHRRILASECERVLKIIQYSKVNDI